MKRAIFAAFALQFLSASFGWAGEPISTKVKCPVGGQRFKITQTLSCTTMGRTMSLSPVTSCDFITRLPVCPKNGLPMYQDFSDAQIAELKVFLKTPEYAALMPLSPWQRAYGVAVHLGQSGSSTAFGILVQAFWYEPDEFLASETALDQLLLEAKAELPRNAPEDRIFREAIIAYALTAAGRIKEANALLSRVEKAGDTPDDLRQYAATVRSCQKDVKREGCRPLDPFLP
jgi:hypothetical protein